MKKIQQKNLPLFKKNENLWKAAKENSFCTVIVEPQFVEQKKKFNFNFISFANLKIWTPNHQLANNSPHLFSFVLRSSLYEGTAHTHTRARFVLSTFCIFAICAFQLSNLCIFFAILLEVEKFIIAVELIFIFSFSPGDVFLFTLADSVRLIKWTFV